MSDNQIADSKFAILRSLFRRVEEFLIQLAQKIVRMLFASDLRSFTSNSNGSEERVNSTVAHIEH